MIPVNFNFRTQSIVIHSPVNLNKLRIVIEVLRKYLGV